MGLEYFGDDDGVKTSADHVESVNEGPESLERTIQTRDAGGTNVVSEVGGSKDGDGKRNAVEKSGVEHAQKEPVVGLRK